jgi:hypothetical protein
MVKKNNTQIRCRSCDAPMFWAETSRGKRIPLDQQPVHDGNMRIILRPGLIPLAFSLKELEGFADTRQGESRRLRVAFRDVPAGEGVEKMTEQLELAIAGRDAGMARVEAKAGPKFSELARDFVISFLREHGDVSGEKITNACKKSGIVPHDDRAFGPVYMTLVRQGWIVKVGTCKRLKGHHTAGGNIWRLVL